MNHNKAKDPERDYFDRLIERIENNEDDKDRFLKAARLERHERPPMSDARFESLLYLIGFTVAMAGFLTFFWMMTL